MALAVINLVGLCEDTLACMPELLAWSKTRPHASFAPVFPAVTTVAQTTYLTGLLPEQHGIVANGWFDRSLQEILFWKQSEKLVAAPLLWQQCSKRPQVAKLFWWYNMGSSADICITPRPLYPADGRKVFDIHTQPMQLRESIKQQLGAFPFQQFWGPGAGLASSRWIAESAKHVYQKHCPELSLVYLPHLDYELQRSGPHSPASRKAMLEADELVMQLIEFYQAHACEVVVLSEYGIEPVSKPLYLNRLFRAKGWLSLKDELGREALDPFASKVFAVADHQAAHVYVQDPELLEQVRELLQHTEGIAKIHTSTTWPSATARQRAGDFILEAQQDYWFCWYHWLDDGKAPDFARCVDIFRKSGYDPCELLLDPELRCPALKIGGFLLKKKLGLRALLEVIPLDATLVKGSHGRVPQDKRYWPMAIGMQPQQAVDVHGLLLTKLEQR